MKTTDRTSVSNSTSAMRPARVPNLVSNFVLICAHSKIRIAEARVGFKAANRESFPYIMHIVDEPRKFSPSNVLTYTVFHIPLVKFSDLYINGVQPPYLQNIQKDATSHLSHNTNCILFRAFGVFFTVHRLPVF